MLRSFLVLLFLLLPAVGSAQDDATHAAAARALFTEGVTAADAEDWATAAERFRRAAALRSSPTIALNLAVALGHLGQLVEASELLRRVLHDPTANDALRASATATLADVEPRLTWIELEATGDLTGITFDSDGHPLSADLIGTAVPMDPGSHRVSATRAGEVVASAEVTLAEGERRALTLEIPAAPSDEVEASEGRTEVPISALTPDPPPSGPDPLAIGLGVAGGVVLAGGLVALIVVVAMPAPSPFVGNAGFVEVSR